MMLLREQTRIVCCVTSPLGLLESDPSTNTSIGQPENRLLSDRLEAQVVTRVNAGAAVHIPSMNFWRCGLVPFLEARAGACCPAGFPAR